MSSVLAPETVIVPLGEKNPAVEADIMNELRSYHDTFIPPLQPYVDTRGLQPERVYDFMAKVSMPVGDVLVVDHRRSPLVQEIVRGWDPNKPVGEAWGFVMHLGAVGVAFRRRGLERWNGHAFTEGVWVNLLAKLASRKVLGYSWQPGAAPGGYSYAVDFMGTGLNTIHNARSETAEEVGGGMQEALAELCRARYLQSVHGRSRGKDELAFTPHGDVPVPFGYVFKTSMLRRANLQAAGTWSAIGIELLIREDPSLFPLLIKAHLSSQEQDKVALCNSINQFGAGLYDRLMREGGEITGCLNILFAIQKALTGNE